jgi:hypothetical protein
MQPAIDLTSLEAVIRGLSEGERADLIEKAKAKLELPFLAAPGPQTEALKSKADILGYGGQAGGGKSALMIGAAARDHSSALILRREATQLDGLLAFAGDVCGANGWDRNKVEKTFTSPDGRVLKFAGLNQPDDWRNYAGIGRDFYGFDEAAEFLEEQVSSLIGWLRSTIPGQRCRVILASNPPRGGDGEWFVRWFGPWLDPMHANPAAHGELRWAIRVEDELEWVDGPGEYERRGERYQALSYTFIGAKLDDNPYLKDTNYRATLQNLPEPLRSQLLYGDFLAGREDHAWQVIPTAWVKLAQERWRKAPNIRRPMIAIATDVAMGGADNLVTGSLHPMGGGSEGWYIPPLEVVRGVDVTSPIQIAQNIMRLRKDGADVSVDLTGGWGTGVKSHLEQDHETNCHGFVYSEKSGARTADGKLGMANIRAELWWKLREALDPEGGTGEKLALPDDPRLLAELTTPRWHLRKTDIVIESKDEIAKRIGGSTDRADVVAMLWARRHSVAVQLVKRSRAEGRNYRGDYIEAAPDDNVLDW